MEASLCLRLSSPASFQPPLPPPRVENCKINRAKWSFHGSHRVSTLSAVQGGGGRQVVELAPPAPQFQNLFHMARVAAKYLTFGVQELAVAENLAEVSA